MIHDAVFMSWCIGHRRYTYFCGNLAVHLKSYYGPSRILVNSFVIELSSVMSLKFSVFFISFFLNILFFQSKDIFFWWLILSKKFVVLHWRLLLHIWWILSISVLHFWIRFLIFNSTNDFFLKYCFLLLIISCWNWKSTVSSVKEEQMHDCVYVLKTKLYNILKYKSLYKSENTLFSEIRISL